MDEEKNKPARENRDFTPLSMPLDTFGASDDDDTPDAPPAETADDKPEKPESIGNKKDTDKEQNKPQIKETELWDKVFERVDKRVAEQSSLKRADFPFGLIVLAIFLAPFLFNLGDELYYRGKAYLFKYADVQPMVSDKELAGELLRQNQKITAQLDNLLKSQKEMLQAGINKVVVVNNEPIGSFSFKFEKQKIFELSGVDMDDPMEKTTAISKIRSPEVLLALMDSFNRILLNAEHAGVSNLHVKNAVEGKKQAVARLQQLK